MCDTATMTVIEDVVAQKTGANEMFTAHDVTRACRQKAGPQHRIDHKDVKTELHGMFVRNELPGYTRSLANLPAVKGPQPFVYHPFGADVSTYGGQPVQVVVPQGGFGGQQVVVPSTVAVPPSIGPADDDEDDGDAGVNKTLDGGYLTDSRNTLCLPKSLLEGAGLRSGNEAYVSADTLTASVVVSKAAPDLSVLKPLSTYTVDKYGNVRVTQFTLQKGGLQGRLFDIKGDASQVTVRKRN